VTLEQRHYERLLDFRTGLRRFLRWSADRAITAGLTPAQHQLLLAIRGHRDPAGPTISDVAGYLLIRHHSAVELVDRAVAAGLVERGQDADDSRAVRLRLTRDGSERLALLTSAHLEELERLAPQLEALWDGLDTAVEERRQGP
jgi:DNA-binding MarR family transcriptional regulator